MKNFIILILFVSSIFTQASESIDFSSEQREIELSINNIMGEISVLREYRENMNEIYKEHRTTSTLHGVVGGAVLAAYVGVTAISYKWFMLKYGAPYSYVFFSRNVVALAALGSLEQALNISFTMAVLAVPTYVVAKLGFDSATSIDDLTESDAQLVISYGALKEINLEISKIRDDKMELPSTLVEEYLNALVAGIPSLLEIRDEIENTDKIISLLSDKIEILTSIRNNLKNRYY